MTNEHPCGHAGPFVKQTDYEPSALCQCLECRHTRSDLTFAAGVAIDAPQPTKKEKP